MWEAGDGENFMNYVLGLAGNYLGRWFRAVLSMEKQNHPKSQYLRTYDALSVFDRFRHNRDVCKC
jgi:hypothetical protein